MSESRDADECQRIKTECPDAPDGSIGYILSSKSMYVHIVYPILVVQYNKDGFDALKERVTSMWESLSHENKDVYRERMITENNRRADIYSNWMSTRPKKPMTSYMIFRLKNRNIKKFPNVVWNMMKSEDKQIYRAEYEKMHRVYVKEKERWGEQLKCLKDNKKKKDSVGMTNWMIYYNKRKEEVLKDKHFIGTPLNTIRSMLIEEYSRLTDMEKIKYARLIKNGMEKEAPATTLNALDVIRTNIQPENMNNLI
jgi:hypothetical protein